MAYVANMSLIPNLKNHSKDLLFHLISIQLCSMCDSLFCGYVADEFIFVFAIIDIIGMVMMNMTMFIMFIMVFMSMMLMVM